MVHLDEGTLQGYLDDELTPRGRPGAAEHILGCARCRAELDALRQANRSVAEALAELDPPTPAAPPRPAVARKARLGGGVAMRAAALVLFVAAAASASAPGSPVREWITGLVRPAAETGTEQPAVGPEPMSPAVEASPRAADPAGVAVPATGDLDVVVTGLRDGAVRLVRTGGASVAVSARGAASDPLFRLTTGRIEVVGGAGGEIVVAAPGTRGTVRLVVDGRRYAEVVDGEVRVLVPGRREGDAVVWP